jgi:hypothetical protein
MAWWLGSSVSGVHTVYVCGVGDYLVGGGGLSPPPGLE